MFRTTSSEIIKNTLSPPAHTTDRGIKGQLFIGFGSIIVILLIIISTTLYFIADTKRYSSQLINSELPLNDQFIDLYGEIYQTQTSLQSFIITGDQQYIIKNKSSWDSINKITEAIDNLERSNIQESERKSWQDLKDMLGKVSVVNKKIVDMSADKPAAIQVFSSEYLPLISQLSFMLNVGSIEGQSNVGALDLKSQSLAQGAKDILNNLSEFQTIEYILFAIGLLASFLIAFYTLRVIATITKHIMVACHNIVGSLEQVRHAVELQSAGSSEQASSINEITASLSEIEKSSSQTMNKARKWSSRARCCGAKYSGNDSGKR
jgi:CHASE3 domain sensor protein